MFPINYLAVLVAAVVNFYIGFMFHGPIFGKLWMKLADIHPTGQEKLKDMVSQMVKNLLVDILFAYFLAVVYLFAHSSFFVSDSVLGGMLVAFYVWLGFIFTGSSIEVIWMGKSCKLWYFELFCSLVSMLAMGAIIGAW